MKSYSFLLITLVVWLTSLNQAAKKLAPQIRAVTTANGIAEQSVNSLRHTGRLPGGVGKRELHGYLAGVGAGVCSWRYACWRISAVTESGPLTMTTFPEDADSSAMRRLREGEDLALNEIMERWQRRVTSYLLRFIGNETAAIDLAQETFVRVYQSRERYRPVAKFSTWLFAIASNLAREHLRWLRRHPTASLNETDESDSERPLSERVAADGLNPSEAADSGEQTRAVREAVMSLPNDLREAVYCLNTKTCRTSRSPRSPVVRKRRWRHGFIAHEEFCGNG